VAKPSTTKPRSGAKTAERFLDVAEQLFAQNGYAGTSLRDVAAEVGVKTASLYNHFPSKEALYSAVIERGFRPVRETINTLFDDEPGRAPSAAEVFSTMMQIMNERPNFARLMQYEALTGGEHLTKIVRQWMVPTFKLSQQALEVSRGGDVWDDDEIPLLLYMLHNIFMGYYSMAPLYKEVTGQDPLTEVAQKRLQAFLDKLWYTLWRPADTPAE